MTKTMNPKTLTTPTTAAARLAAAAMAAAVAALAGPAARAANTPVSGVTGWNQDLVVEASATDAVAATTSAFDNGNNYIYYQNGVAGSGGGGLPTSGTFTSNSNAATTFQYQPYTANNALFMTATANTGTLTLGTPAQLGTIALLDNAANGNATVNYTLNYTSGATATGSFTAYDWFNNSSYAITSLGRAKRTTPIGGFEQNTNTSGNPKMFEVDITNPNPALSLASISFQQTTTGGTASAIWAVSAASSAIFTYTGAVNGSFDTTTANFSSNGSAATYADGSNVLFDDSATGTTNVTVAAAGVSPAGLTFNNNSKAYTFTGGPIAGAGTLTVAGSGTVTLNNANTYTGATTVSAGTLVVGPAGAVASSALTVASGGTLTVQTGGQLTAAAPALADNGTVNFNNPTRTLGALTGTGTVNVNNTALSVGTGTAFTGTFGGTGTNTLNVSGGSVSFTAASSLAAFNGGVAVGATNAGSGTLVLNENSGQLGLTAGGTPITVTSTGGTVTGTTGGAVTFAGNLTAAGTAATTLGTGNGSSFTLTGILSGPAPVQITSSGLSTFAFAGTATNTGPVQINGGTSVLSDSLNVTFAKDNALSPAGGLVLAASATPVTVDLAGHNQTVGYLSGSGSANVSVVNSGGSATLTIVNGNASTGAATFGTAITGGGISVVKTGGGTQILSGNNTYGGGTTITAGTLTASNVNAFGSNTVTLNGGTLGLLGPVSQTFTGFAGYKVNQNAAAAGANAANISADGTTANLTNGTGNEATSVFSPNPIAVGTAGGFTTSFLWSHANLNTSPYSVADGFAFVIQNNANASTSLGTAGGGLGYKTITSSIAVPIDLYSGYGSGFGTGFGSNGNLPANNTFLSVLPIVVQNENLAVTLTYNGSAQTLTENLVGQNAAGAATGNTYSHTFTGIDLTALLGGNTGYVGFTGGTGGVTVTQNVSNFTFTTTSSLTGPGSIPNAVTSSPNTRSSIALATAAGNATASAVGPLTLGAGSVVALAATGPNRGVLTVPSLTVATNAAGTAPAAQLNLAGNDLVVQNGNLQAVTALAASGYAGGTFNGSGIASSAAAADTRRLTTVGVIANNDNGGGQLYGSGATLGLFDGANPGSGDVLVKYTYFGDANLDGRVDGADYGRIDAGYNSQPTGTPLTGWYNGDFNYDGKVDGSDYTLIDNAFNLQAGRLTTSVAAADGGAGTGGITAASTDEIAPVVGTSAVPEPTTVGLLAVATGGLLTRRRRI